jgi:ABC-type transport system involved in cytochrome bd biosynthesis fused ATPase/permease subunit
LPITLTECVILLSTCVLQLDHFLSLQADVAVKQKSSQSLLHRQNKLSKEDESHGLKELEARQRAEEVQHQLEMIEKKRNAAREREPKMDALRNASLQIIESINIHNNTPPCNSEAAPCLHSHSGSL